MKLFFPLAALLISSASFAQNNLQGKLDSFSARFVTAMRTHEQQKVFMATDKSVYTNGESIWLKAFLVNSISGKLNNSSRFLFVDLVDNKDDVIKTLLLDAVNKQTDSKIVLPQSLASGPYWLRAYTRQMLETDAGNICVKPVYVINRADSSASREVAKKMTTEDTVMRVKFYPEGGNMITGVNNIIAVHVTDSKGTPLQVKGLIRDNYDAVRAAFTTDSYGLAKFDFEPSGHRDYRAVIAYNGKERSYALPAFNFFRGQISVTMSSPNFIVRVLLADSIYTKNTLSYLLAISKDSLVFASIGRGLYQVPVPEQKLPDGINTFYLFDENFHLLSERSIYVHDNLLHLNATIDKREYLPNEKVTLNVSLTGAAHQPIPSLLAISVADTAFLDHTLECPLRLTDGQPVDNIFMARNNCLPDNETDLLMLMKKKNYDSFGNEETATFSKDEDSILYIKGRLTDDNGKPITNDIVSVFSSMGKGIFNSDTTDNNGRFRFKLVDYPDSTQMAFNITDLKGRGQTPNIILDSLEFPKVHTPELLKIQPSINPEAIHDYLSALYPSVGLNKQVLPHVLVKNTANYDVSKRISENSTILSSDQINERNGVGNAVLNVAGVQMLNGFLVLNRLITAKNPDANSEPLLIVNGVEVFPSSSGTGSSPVLSYLNSFDPKSIDFIEIIRGSEAARYGMRGGNGVILLNTANTVKTVNMKGNNLKIFYVRGISKPALFPISENPKTVGELSTVSEDHSTLFWNGDYFNNVTSTNLSFYTSDVPATYKITITGIDSHGDVIYKTISFKTR